jgi:hypothetical protein
MVKAKEETRPVGGSINIHCANQITHTLATLLKDFYTFQAIYKASLMQNCNYNH